MDEIPVKTNSKITLYAILTTVISITILLTLLVVIYFNPINLNRSVDTNGVTSATISLETSTISKTIRLEIPYDTPYSKESNIIEFSYMDNLGIAPSYINDTKVEANKNLVISVNKSEMKVSDSGGYIDHKCINVKNVISAEIINSNYYRVLEKSDAFYDYYFIGYKTENFYDKDSKLQPTCYEESFYPGGYKNYMTWAILYKISKEDTSNTIKVFDDLVVNSINLERITLKYKGDYKNSLYYKYYSNVDNTEYYYFIKFFQPALEKQDPNNPIVSTGENDEDNGDTYLIRKDMISNQDLLSSSNINREFVVEGQAETVQEGMPSTYKYYSINKIEKK